MRHPAELRSQGTQVVGVHVGFVDTDMTAGLDTDKIPPRQVAVAALDALESNRPEALVDDFSRFVKSSLHDDLSVIYPGIEAQFAGAAGVAAAPVNSGRRTAPGRDTSPHEQLHRQLVQ